MVAGLLVATGLLAPAIAPVAAADPAPDPLAGPFVDVALVPALGAESGSEPAPRLLAVRAGGTGVPGEVAVVLLAADGEDWTVRWRGPGRDRPCDSGTRPTRRTRRLIRGRDHGRSASAGARSP